MGGNRIGMEYSDAARGQIDTGQQLRLGVTPAGSRAAAEAVVALCPEGRSVQVWHNPGNLSEAFLEQSKPLAVAPLVLAIGLIAFSGYLAGVY